MQRGGKLKIIDNFSEYVYLEDYTGPEEFVSNNLNVELLDLVDTPEEVFAWAAAHAKRVYQHRYCLLVLRISDNIFVYFPS